MDELLKLADHTLDNSMNHDSAFRPIIPLPDPLLPVEEFDYGLMPEGAFKEFIRDISERMQCPPDYVAVTVMVVLSTVIGRSHQIRPKEYDDWVVVPNLWALILGRPGMLKTPAMDAGLKPLKRAEIRAKEEYETELKLYATDCQLSELTTKLVESEAKTLIKNKKPDQARALLEESHQALDAPSRGRFIVVDATVEKLGELENENPNGILNVRDEMSGFLRTIDNENRPNDRAFYLEGWNGTGAYCYDRIGRGTIDIPHHVISMLGTIQPGRFAGYVRAAIKQGTGDDGLAQRFQLAVYPDEPKSWVNVDRYPQKEAKNRVYETIDHLIERVKLIDEPVILKFSPEAQSTFNEFRDDLENKKLRNSDDHPALISHLAKYRSLMPSLALIIHIIDENQSEVIPPVSDHAAIKACAWCDYLESHARRIYSAATNNTFHIARQILIKIKNNKLESGFTTRVIQRKNWSGLNDMDDIRDGLGLLTANKFINEELVKTGGRDSITYIINPALWEKI